MIAENTRQAFKWTDGQKPLDGPTGTTQLSCGVTENRIR